MIAETTTLQELLGERLLKIAEKHAGTYFCVAPDDLLETLTTLRDKHDYKFFSECVGADYSTWTHERDLSGRFEVVYNLLSLSTGNRVFVKTSVSDGESIPSAMPVFQGAEYPEKEIGDMYGIKFTGNELKPGERFMLPDDWVGFPLRKEYPLGGEDVLFDIGTRGPAVEDKMRPHAGESFEGKTGTEEVSGR